MGHHQSFQKDIYKQVKKSKGQLNLYNKGFQSRFFKELILSHKSEFVKLRKLYLTNNLIGAEGVISLAEVPFDMLLQLNLCGNQVGPIGVKSLDCKAFQNLLILDLMNNSIGVDGCKYLSLASFINLTKLYLYNNKIRDEGARYLSCGYFPKLVILDIGMMNFIHVEIISGLKEYATFVIHAWTISRFLTYKITQQRVRV